MFKRFQILVFSKNKMTTTTSVKQPSSAPLTSMPELNQYALDAMTLMGKAFIKTFQESMAANKNKYTQGDHSKRYQRAITTIGLSTSQLTRVMSFTDLFNATLGSVTGMSLNEFIALKKKAQPQGYGTFVNSALTKTVTPADLKTMSTSTYGTVNVSRKYKKADLYPQVTQEVRQETRKVFKEIVRQVYDKK
jgi:hypothetical protein